MAGLPISLSFGYEITSGPVGMYQTLNYKIFCIVTIIFYPYYVNLRRD